MGIYARGKIFRLLSPVLFQLLFITASANAQFINAGPVAGGVTDSSARIYVRTHSAGPFTLEVSTDSTFTSPPIIITDSAIDANFKVRIVDVNGLAPSTQYFYRFLFGGVADPIQGRFRTFPVPGEKGYYKIVVGSCNYIDNFPLFQSIKDFNPDLFLHLGDWNYPPSVPGLGSDYNLYPEKRALSFASRFQDNNMRLYVQPFTPVDYIYDDDYARNNVEGATVPRLDVTTAGPLATNNFYTEYLDPDIRTGAIQAYYDNFPGYPLTDTTQGIYHRITLGNVDIFMTDGRLPKSPSHDPFIYDPASSTWSFQPDSNHSILGRSQREWLLDGLRNSTADWKIIGSGVIFNPRYKRVLNLGLTFQGIALSLAGISGSGATLASQMAYNWAGYPADQDSLLKLYKSGEVKDMVFVSGDTHSSVLDDGTNSGIPEMQASGLAAGDEATLYYYLDSIGGVLGQPSIKDSMWNGGGSGLSPNNHNFSDTYGTVEVFGSDSLRMCVVDELDQTLGCVTLKHSSLSSGISSVILKNNYLIRVIFPNPAKDKIKIFINPEFIQKTVAVMINDMQGRQLFYQETSGPTIEILLNSYPAGVYTLKCKSGRQTESRRFVVR